MAYVVEHVHVGTGGDYAPDHAVLLGGLLSHPFGDAAFGIVVLAAVGLGEVAFLKYGEAGVSKAAHRADIKKYNSWKKDIDCRTRWEGN